MRKLSFQRLVREVCRDLAKGMGMPETWRWQSQALLALQEATEAWASSRTPTCAPSMPSASQSVSPYAWCTWVCLQFWLPSMPPDLRCSHHVLAEPMQLARRIRNMAVEKQDKSKGPVYAAEPDKFFKSTVGQKMAKDWKETQQRLDAAQAVQDAERKAAGKGRAAKKQCIGASPEQPS